MNITDVKIRKIYAAGENGKKRADASMTLDKELAVHNLAIIDSGGRLFVSMPSEKAGPGCYRDIVHPVNQAFRSKVEDAVLRAFADSLKEVTH